MLAVIFVIVNEFTKNNNHEPRRKKKGNHEPHKPTRTKTRCRIKSSWRSWMYRRYEFVV